MPRSRATFRLVLLLLACGQLENAPFLPGVVRGRLSPFDPSVALIAAKDGGVVAPSADGTFSVSVPPGSGLLFVVASERLGALLPVREHGEAREDLGLIATERLGAIDLDFSGAPSQGAHVEVEGFPVPVATSEPGELRIGRLPAGCYHLVITLQSTRPLVVDPCLEPGEDLDLEWPTFGRRPGTIGCHTTGCEDGLLCNSSTGACEP